MRVQQLTYTDSTANLFFSQPSSTLSTAAMSELTPEQEALLDAFSAASDLVPPGLRQQFLLIGGAATIAHGEPRRRTTDVDIAGTAETLSFLWAAAEAGIGGFQKGKDERISWLDPSRDWKVPIDICEQGGGWVPLLQSAHQFRNGYMATISDLLLVRATTVLDRGDIQDYEDFGFLLGIMTSRGLTLPDPGVEGLGVLIEAAELKEDVWGVLLLNILHSDLLRQFGIERI